MYGPLVRPFYVNMRSSKPSEVESLILGKQIFLDPDIFDDIFGISCSDFCDSFKNS